MATLNQLYPTLIDVATRLDPDGKTARIAELLMQTNDVLPDMVWKEGNLPTGERTTVRTGLPSVGTRALNTGVQFSKSQTAQTDEGAAMIEGFSEVDRKIAILGGDPGAFRTTESIAFMQAMNIAFCNKLFYGNAGASPQDFNGLATRYGAISGATNASNVIDAGGATAANFSMWLINWADDKIVGIYPKNTRAGLFHDDVTSNKDTGADGYPVGDVIYDSNGLPYMGYRDHYEWNCGLSVKDWRFAVRVANITAPSLGKDVTQVGNSDLEDLLIQAAETIQSTNGGRCGIYVPRAIMRTLRRQVAFGRRPYLTLEEIGGKKILAFDGIPIRRVDALNVAEARVI